jgi:hypothetical protein
MDSKDAEVKKKKGKKFFWIIRNSIQSNNTPNPITAKPASASGSHPGILPNAHNKIPIATIPPFNNKAISANTLIFC